MKHAQSISQDTDAMVRHAVDRKRTNWRKVRRARIAHKHGFILANLEAAHL